MGCCRLGPATHAGAAGQEQSRGASAGPGGAVCRPDADHGARDPAPPSPLAQHLRRVQLRQRPAHRRVPADPRQADRVRHRYPGAAGGGRPRRFGPEDDERDDRERRSRGDVRRPRRDVAGGRRPQPRAPSAGQDGAGWRAAILVEHHDRSPTAEGPDAQAPLSGNPPTYEAMRTKRFLYVEYADGEREFYDLRTDPYEIDNLAGGLSARPDRSAPYRADASAGLPRRHGLLGGGTRRGLPVTTCPNSTIVAH